MNPKVTSPIDLPVLPELPASPPCQPAHRRKSLYAAGFWKSSLHRRPRA
jgi:hypothetical protein